jgi:hypothetical protein
MARALFNNGVKSNNVTAQTFWLKARAGWAETQPARNEQDHEMTIGSSADCRNEQARITVRELLGSPGNHASV